MGIARGTNIITDGLVFGYDTGYGVADNDTATRFYPGKPTTNLLSSTEAFDNTTYWARSRNSGSVPTVTANTSPNPLGGTYTSKADKVYIPDDGTYPRIAQNFTPASTNTHTFSVWIRSVSGDCRIYLIAFRNSPWNVSGAAHKNLTSEWQRVSFSFTPLDASSHQIYMGAHDDAADKGNTLEFWGAHMEENPEATPYEASSRSNTTSLIDLKRNIDMNVSNVSFNSTGQPTFDGTNDYIDVNHNFGTVNAYSFEWVENASSTHRMPIAGRTNTNFYKYGAYSWRYKHGGTLGEYYHTTGATSGWHHWVVTYDGSTISVYQDAGSLGTNSSSSGSADFSDGFKVGYWSAGGNYAFNGPIPVMKFYDKALSTTEVTQNYNAYKNRFNI